MLKNYSVAECFYYVSRSFFLFLYLTPKEIPKT